LNGQKVFGQKEIVCEVEVILSACTVKWVEGKMEEDEVGRRNRGRRNRGRRNRGGGGGRGGG
jgi:hypothetical protein